MKRFVISLFALFSLSAPALAGETVRIGIGTQDTTINTVHAGLLVRELKLLDKYLPHTGKYAGVEYDVVWKNFTSGPPLNSEMLAGKLDIGSLGDFPSILNGTSFAKQDQRSVYIATLSGNPTGAGNGLVVPSDSPAQSLSDLKGKTISVPFGSAAHGMLLRAIRDLGWDPERDVKLVSQSPEVGGSALQAHQIDAHADFVPFAELFPFRGYARKIYDGGSVGVPTSHGVVARGAFVDQHPELVVAFLRAVIEADRLFTAEPEKYAELVHKVSGVDAEVVYLFHGPGGIQRRNLAIRPEVRQSLAVAQETLTLLGRADRKIDLTRWVDDRFVRQAAEASGYDYKAHLEQAPVTIFPGRDARDGQALTDSVRVAEIWVKGEDKIRRYASVASALTDLGALGRAGKATRVVLVHDRVSGLKLLADKAFYVLPAKSGKDAGKAGGKDAGKELADVAPFLTRLSAERWAKGHGGEIVTFDRAKAVVGDGAIRASL